ncbi:MAG: acyltransferase family protein [Acetobacter aceti]|nr:acyltransferase family protein [Acetobacter aceti]
MAQNHAGMFSLYSKRDVSVDIVRGIAIILVVLGHANRGQMEGMVIPSINLQILDFVIYSVHMPTFFFLSGYFAFISISREPSDAFIKSRVVNIIWPYCLWSIIYCVVGHAMSSLTHVHHMVAWNQLLMIGWRPIGVLWFLYALFFMQIGAVLLRAHPAIILMSSLVADAVVLFTPSDALPQIVMDIIVQAPFFYIGFLMAERGFPALPVIRKAGLWSACSLVVYGLLACLMFEAHVGRPVQFIMLPVGFLGIFGLASLSRVFVMVHALSCVASVLERLGRASLAIYLLHILVLALVPRILHQMHVNSVSLTLACGTVIGVAGSYALYLGLEKIRIARFFALR